MELLLQGTRQITRPRVVAVCTRLKVDYAMAMTGFDIRGGRSVPRFEGVVVCEEFADQVEEEWLRAQRCGCNPLCLRLQLPLLPEKAVMVST